MGGSLGNFILARNFQSRSKSRFLLIFGPFGNPPEFAQPRLSGFTARLSPARGYKFGCVSSCMAGHYPGILMTGHTGTNTPKFVPARWGRPPLDSARVYLLSHNFFFFFRAFFGNQFFFGEWSFSGFAMVSITVLRFLLQAFHSMWARTRGAI